MLGLLQHAPLLHAIANAARSRQALPLLEHIRSLATATLTQEASAPVTTANWPFVVISPSHPAILPERVDRRREYSVEQAISLLKAKQPSLHSVDVAVRFLLDPRRSDHLVRGSVLLPHGLGKSVTVAVFAKGEDAELARELGADVIGDDELIARIISTSGEAINFDKLIATPDYAKALAKAGRFLGPKGLMPNPKLGTLTSDVRRAVQEVRQGRLDYRMGRDAAVRAALGKVSMPEEHLATHVGGLVHSLLENKPKGLKGAGLEGYVQNMLIRSSQSPSYRLSLRSCEAAAQLFADQYATPAAQEGAAPAAEAAAAPGANEASGAQASAAAHMAVASDAGAGAQAGGQGRTKAGIASAAVPKG